MFERYTDPARRVIFFARYETSQFGGTTIETEHLLLGLIREDGELLRQLLPGATPIETLRKQIADSLEVRDKVPTSIDLPLSDECKRILAYAAEEADALRSEAIAKGHLLLGIMREDGCSAAKLLTQLGLELKTVRERAAEFHDTPGHLQSRLEGRAMIPKTPLPAAGVVRDEDTAKRIAEAVWSPRVSAVPGDHVIAQGAVLEHGVWIVTGFHAGNNTQTNLAAFIQKEDGKILRIHQDAAAQ